MADTILYKIPFGETNPQIAGLEEVGYAENFYVCEVPNVDLIPVAVKDKFLIRKVDAVVGRGIKFFMAPKHAAKLYQGYSSGQAASFPGEDFDQAIGIRIERPMTETEIAERYEAIRIIRSEMVKDYYRQKFVNLSVNKTEQEKATFAVQEQEARAFINDNATITPNLTILAQARGETVSVLAQKILTAIDSYNQQVIGLLAEQEGYLSQLKAATGDSIINIELPFQTTIIPGDSRWPNPTS